MSLFTPHDIDCPACGVVNEYEIVESVNADRRPDLRDALLDGVFQRLSCASCGEQFRVEPEFTYIHVGGNQYLTVWPSSRVGEWPQLEKLSDENFREFFGPGTDPVTEEMGKELRQRCVFGWESVREKIALAAVEIDDVTAELAKLAMMRWSEEIEISLDTELRFIGIKEDDQAMLFGVYQSGEEQLLDQVSISRDLLAEVEADAGAWKSLRDRLTEGSFVDVFRLIAVPETAAAET
jgi:CpXC protein